MKQSIDDILYIFKYDVCNLMPLEDTYKSLLKLLYIIICNNYQVAYPSWVL